MENNTKKVKIYEVDGHKTNHIIEGENTSTIVSELIALAARYCDYYASDIVYDVNSFARAVEDEEAYDKYLCFYDSGVHATTIDVLDNSGTGMCHTFENGRACYHLTYDPETQTQALVKVDVHVFRNF